MFTFPAFILISTAADGWSQSALDRNLLISKWVQVVIYLFFIVNGLISITYSCIRMNKEGVSKELRMLLLKRHIIYIVFWAFLNQYYFINNIIMITGRDYKYTDSVADYYIDFTKILCVSQGIVLPMIRLFELYFWLVIKRESRALYNRVKACCGCGTKEKTREEMTRETLL